MYGIPSTAEYLKVYFEKNPKHRADLSVLIGRMHPDLCYCLDAKGAKQRFNLRVLNDRRVGVAPRRLALRTLLHFVHSGEGGATTQRHSCSPNCINVHHMYTTYDEPVSPLRTDARFKRVADIRPLPPHAAE